jgi:hypothetical protein
MGTPAQDFKPIWDKRFPGRGIGHDHFWQRALSRRQLLVGSVGVVGAAAAASPFGAGLARAAAPGAGQPNPIPGGTQIDGLGFFHFNFPTTSNPVGATTVVENGRGDPSTITDFNGFIGLGDFGGGTGKDQSNTTLYWAADVRFMDGEYVGTDGRHRQAAFTFV